MQADFLNPVEILGLSNPEELDTSRLRRALKRFRTEMEIEDRETFPFRGKEYPLSTLARQVDEAIGNPELFAAYAYAASLPDFGTFLRGGKVPLGLPRKIMANPRLRPLLGEAFVEAFSAAFRRSVTGGAYDVMHHLAGWEPERLGLSESSLYGSGRIILRERCRELTDLFSRLTAHGSVGSDLRVVAAPQLQAHFPPQLLSRLPTPCAEIGDRLLDVLLPALKVINRYENYHDVAYIVADHLLPLQNLPPETRLFLRETRENSATAFHRQRAETAAAQERLARERAAKKEKDRAAAERRAKEAADKKRKSAFERRYGKWKKADPKKPPPANIKGFELDPHNRLLYNGVPLHAHLRTLWKNLKRGKF